MPSARGPRATRRRRGLTLVVAAVALAVAAAAVSLLVTRKSVFASRTLVMATGPEGGANEELGTRYRAILARAGLDVRLVPTAGAVENLEKLRDPRSGVDVAFVDAGITDRHESPDVVSLGTISFEALWLFHRDMPQGARAQTLRGRRISIGPEGSGTRVLARRLLALNGMDEKSNELLGLAPEQAADALVRGEIDAAVLLTSLQSPAVRKLLAAGGVTLATYPRADAYVALFPYLTKVVLPAGVADLERNVPPADVTLLAVEGSLAAREDLHPALQFLLLEAASEVHGGPGIFNRAGRFPAPEAIDLPLSRHAQEFYKTGRPYLHRHLPFWLADVAERLLLLLVPFLAVVLPLARYAPMVYEFANERRMFSLYRELKVIEVGMEAISPGDSIAPLTAALEELAKRVNRLRVPLHFTQRLFILKSHIAAARERLARLEGSG